MRPILTLLSFLYLTAGQASAQLIDSLRVDQDGVTGQWTSLALDAAENPYIAYFDSTDQRLRFAAWNGTAFDIEAVDSTQDGGMNCDLALDGDGNPHISYYAYSTDRDSVSLYYANRSGGSWTVEHVEGGPVESFGRSTWTSIGLGEDGPSIAYLEVAPSHRLKYAARGVGGAWGTAVADPTSGSGFEAALVLDDSGTPHISHLHFVSGGGLELRYSTLTNLVAWSNEVVSNADTIDIGWADIDLLAGDVPAIAYLRGTSNLLYVAVQSGAGNTWAKSFYDTAGVGPNNDTKPVAIHVDEQNRVNVAYHYGPGGTLRYARTFHGIPFWVTVDENGTVGEYNSITLDGAEAAHLSYYDMGRKDLKYATAGIRLDGITAIPATADMLVDSVRALSAQADFRSGFVDITFNAFWNSRDASIARVDSFGFVKAVRAGSTYVVADFDVFSDSVLVRVDDPNRVAVQLDYPMNGRIWDLVAFPLEPESAGDDIFSKMFALIGTPTDESWKVGRWDPALGMYATLNSGSARSAPCEGYWFITEDTLSFRSPRGFYSNRTRGIALENGPADAPGWNQLGMPHEGVLDVDDMLVTDGTDTLAITDPTNTWTERSVVGWVNRDYANLGDVRTGRGFWVRKLTADPVSIVFPVDPVTAGQDFVPPRDSGVTKRTESALWSLGLRVLDEGRSSNELVLGAGSFASDEWIQHARALPPASPSGGPRLAALHDDRGRWNGAYRESRLSQTEPFAWTVVIEREEREERVERDENGPGTITIRTEDLAAHDRHGADGAQGAATPLLWEWEDPRSGARGEFVAGETFSLAVHGRRTEYFLRAKSASDDVPVNGAVTSVFRFAYPNPFRETSGFRFQLAGPTEVSVTLYNLAGREVRSLRSTAATRGDFVLVWDGRDARGKSVPPGVYLARMEWGGRQQTARVVKIR